MCLKTCSFQMVSMLKQDNQFVQLRKKKQTAWAYPSSFKFLSMESILCQAAMTNGNVKSAFTLIK